MVDNVLAIKKFTELVFIPSPKFTAMLMVENALVN
jgi:hypothetical protein